MQKKEEKYMGARVRVPQNKSGKCSIPRVSLYVTVPPAPTPGFN